MSRATRLGGIGAVLAATAAVGLSACTPYGATLSRPWDPVVMTGSELADLRGATPQNIVGFSWDGSAWYQVPVQVDERDMVSPGQIYHLPTSSWPTLYGTTRPYLIPVYTPPTQTTAGYASTATYTPPDSNPSFDADDELSFLADSTGKQAGPSDGHPAGVDAATRQQVRVTDPLKPDQSGFVYLYRSATLTGGGARTTGVVYHFSLDSGPYQTTYKMGTGSLSPNNTWGFNPEHSTVVAPAYTMTFADRWLNDGLTITKGGSTGGDIFDRSHYYATGGCGRSEDTFDGGASNPGEGAFVVNLSGPVRAIRSYIGANSYVFTVNTDVFYPNRQDTVTELRGHAGMPGYGTADDYTTGMTGLVYSDAMNSNVPIDGSPDVVTPVTYTTGSPPPPGWQMVTGPQGSVVTVRLLDTDITGLAVASVRQDRNPASPAQCTGDSAAWGQHGMNVTSPVNNVPNTDPTLSATPNTFTIRRTRYIEVPNLAISVAAQIERQVRSPLEAAVDG